MNHDHLRTEEFMTQEAVNLVSDMVANSPFNVSFTVGGKLNDYRRIFRRVVEEKKLLLIDENETSIIFGYHHKKPCIITYLPSSEVKQ